MRLSYALTASLMLLASGSLLRSRLSDDRVLAFTEVGSSDRPSQNYGVVFDISITGSSNLPDMLSPKITFDEDVTSQETTTEAETSHSTDDSQQMTTDLNAGEADATRTADEADSNTTQRDEGTPMEIREQTSQTDASLTREDETSHQQVTAGQAIMQLGEGVKKSFIQLQLKTMAEPADSEAAADSSDARPITDEAATTDKRMTEDSMKIDHTSMKTVVTMTNDMMASNPGANTVEMTDFSMMTNEPLELSITTKIEFSVKGDKDNTEAENTHTVRTNEPRKFKGSKSAEDEADETEAEDTTTVRTNEPREIKGSKSTEDEADETEAEDTTTVRTNEPREIKGSKSTEDEADETEAEDTTTVRTNEPREIKGSKSAENEADETEAEDTTTVRTNEPREIKGSKSTEDEADETEAEDTTTVRTNEPREIKGSKSTENEADETEAEDTTTVRTNEPREIKGSKSSEDEADETETEEENSEATTDTIATTSEITGQQAAYELMRLLVADEVSKVLAANEPLNKETYKSAHEERETEAATTEEASS
jgi:hypothetical protein